MVADHSKLRLVGLSTIIGLDEVDALVCDAGLSPEDRASLENQVGRLMVAGPGAPTEHLARLP